MLPGHDGPFAPLARTAVTYGGGLPSTPPAGHAGSPRGQACPRKQRRGHATRRSGIPRN